jgi:hypothetical protein
VTDRYQCHNPRCPSYSGVGVILHADGVHAGTDGLLHCNACTSFVVEAPPDQRKFIAIAIGSLLLLFLLLVLAVRGCPGQGAHVVVISNGGIDAGPGEAIIAAQLDAEIQAAEAHMRMIEQKFDEDLASFDARQREEYDRLRGGEDLEGAARMLSEWNRARSRKVDP